MGISKGTGFSSNAEEIETAFNETLLNVIQPMQEVILDAFEFLLGITGLQFIPLRKSMANEAQSAQNATTAVSMSKEYGVADELIELGEEINEDEWEAIDEMALSDIPDGDFEKKINQTAYNYLTLSSDNIELAKDFASFWKDASEQDTTLFKVRYRYQGNSNPQREFCSKLMGAGKVYRKEDIDLAADKKVNPGLGPEGSDTYDVWLYKGGVNCNHYWERVIYLRKGNQKVSVNQARKMILELDPADRPAAKWQDNDPRVAQVANESNNFWRLS